MQMSVGHGGLARGMAREPPTKLNLKLGGSGLGGLRPGGPKGFSLQGPRETRLKASSGSRRTRPQAVCLPRSADICRV